MPRKYSDALWKRFITACDSFFEKKNVEFSSQKQKELDNLNKKKELISKLKEMSESETTEDSIKDVLARIGAKKFKRILFVCLGDILHTNNAAPLSISISIYSAQEPLRHLTSPENTAQHDLYEPFHAMCVSALFLGL